MLCPVRRWVTTLDCILSKDSYLVLAVRLGPKIYFCAFLWILVRPRPIAMCCLSFQHFIFFLIFCPETPRPVLVQQTAEQFPPMWAHWHCTAWSKQKTQSPSGWCVNIILYPLLKNYVKKKRCMYIQQVSAMCVHSAGQCSNIHNRKLSSYSYRLSFPSLGKISRKQLLHYRFLKAWVIQYFSLLPVI